MESWDYFYARIPEDFRFLNEILGPFSGIPFDVTSPLRLLTVSVNGSVNDPAGFSDFLCAGKGRALMTFQKAPKEWILPRSTPSGRRPIPWGRIPRGNPRRGRDRSCQRNPI